MIVRTDNLRKAYGREEVLHGVGLSVPAGSAFALIGSNGAGKTTTLKILTNILRPSGGEARIFGIDSRRLTWREMRRIGYVSENQQMPRRLTVSQYLGYLRPFYPQWDRELERSILSDLRLPMERRIGDLSHGMRLKMALACALPYRPELLILDEPFSGLDPLVREEFMERLLHQAGEMTILISSHELADIEGVATDVGFLEQGRMLLQESMSDLMARVREVRVTFATEAVVPQRLPKDWLLPRADGNVLTFVATQWDEEAPLGEAALELQGVRHLDARPMGLRSTFTARARAARDPRG
ncbi:MAG: ABC transporter ATP-binding protein [Steroidobacteraceae bacterium]